MPIYEFRCQSCRRKASFFQRGFTPPTSPVCPACGASDMVRCVSGFAFHKSEQTHLEEAGEPSMFPTNPDYYKDPRNIGRWAEKRMSELGIDMPDQVKDMISAAREGELPGSIKDI